MQYTSHAVPLMHMASGNKHASSIEIHVEYIKHAYLCVYKIHILAILVMPSGLLT